MAASENLSQRRFALNDGSGEIPALGFGTSLSDRTQTRNAVKAAVKVGFRHLDAAERPGGRFSKDQDSPGAEQQDQNDLPKGCFVQQAVELHACPHTGEQCGQPDHKQFDGLGCYRSLCSKP